MTLVDQLLATLQENGYTITNPRPRFNPVVERALEDELVEEVTHGEKEPTPAPELPPNVRLVSKDAHQFILYVLETALDVGFWGVNVAVVNELRQHPLPWALVLLDGKPTSGYWLTGRKVNRLAANRWRPIVPNGPNYEVRAPGDVAEATKFSSKEHLLGLTGSLGE
jgi:hypothetical protein